MEILLSIDMSTNPILLQLMKAHDNSMELLETKQVFVPSGIWEHIWQNGSSLNSEPSSTDSALTAEEKSSTHLDILKEAVNSLSLPPSNSVVLLPPQQYFTANANLPFGDLKNLNKILDLEIQDLVPFDLDEFLLQFRSLLKLDSGLYDVHVGILPKKLIRTALELCRRANVEPLVLSTPSSALGAIFSLAPDYFPPTCAILLMKASCLYMLARVEGEIKADRTISEHSSIEEKAPTINLSSPEQIPPDQWDPYFMRAKLALYALEARYQVTFEKVYLLRDPSYVEQLQQTLGRPVEILQFSELIEGKREEADLAGVAASFVRDSNSAICLSNFRTREFSYSPQLSELFTGLKKLLPYASTMLCTLIIMLLVVYVLREQHTNSMENTMKARVTKLLPQAKDSSDQLSNFVDKENSRLDKALSDLGSPIKLSPLDLLHDISRDLPKIPGVEITYLKIRGNRIDIQGTAPDYAAEKSIHKALRSNPVCYRVNQENSSLGSSTSNRITFSFDVRRCE